MPVDMLLYNIIDILNVVDTNCNSSFPNSYRQCKYNTPDLSMLLLKRLVDAMRLY
jgi:hypothetical protein